MNERDRLTEMTELLVVATPMMETKCCHFAWYKERRGVVSDDPTMGFSEIEDGMHPGCAPYRRWLDRLEALNLT